MLTPLSVAELKLRRGVLLPAGLLGSGVKVISGGAVHRSVEKATFENELARRIAFPSETYTYRK